MIDTQEFKKMTVEFIEACEMAGFEVIETEDELFVHHENQNLIVLIKRHERELGDTSKKVTIHLLAKKDTPPECPFVQTVRTLMKTIFQKEKVSVLH